MDQVSRIFYASLCNLIPFPLQFFAHDGADVSIQQALLDMCVDKKRDRDEEHDRRPKKAPRPTDDEVVIIDPPSAPAKPVKLTKSDAFIPDPPVVPRVATPFKRASSITGKFVGYVQSSFPPPPQRIINGISIPCPPSLGRCKPDEKPTDIFAPMMRMSSVSAQEPILTEADYEE
jgi:hypothetical protein